MTVKFHGMPITPKRLLEGLPPTSYCVSYAAPHQVEIAHRIGRGVMLDNGAFSQWTKGKPTDWPGFYRWVEPWLSGHPTTWAVIPDVIDGTEAEQLALIAQWPFGYRGAPVWHMGESLDHLYRLADEWPFFCMGSAARYRQPLSLAWRKRMDDAWNGLARRHRHRQRLPAVHMLRGLQLVRHRWPFASVDSTNIAQNHHRPQNTVAGMISQWEPLHCPTVWHDV